MMKCFFFFFFECFVSKRRESVGFQLDLLSLKRESVVHFFVFATTRTRKEQGTKEKENMRDMFICVYASVVFLLFVRMSAAFRADKKTISPFFYD